MNNEKQNRQLVLKCHPIGIAGPGDFECVGNPTPTITAGQVPVEAHYMGLGTALRLIMRDSDELLFSVKPDDVVFATTDNFPKAFQQVYEGANRGKMLLRLH